MTRDSPARSPLRTGTPLATLLITGCVVAPTTPPPPETVAMSCALPTFAALAETKEYQVKGGVGISAAANTFQCNRAEVVKQAELAPGALDSLALMGKPNPDFQHWKKIETVRTPTFNVAPDRMAFRLKITNQLTRVFRGTGAVLLFQVGGKNLSVSQQNYQELTGLIVPPRTEAEVTVYGPAFTEMPATTTIALFLYDVVTKTDAAGNITEKQNFEWFYNYSIETKRESGVVSRKVSFEPR